MILIFSQKKHYMAEPHYKGNRCFMTRKLLQWFTEFIHVFQITEILITPSTKHITLQIRLSHKIKTLSINAPYIAGNAWIFHICKQQVYSEKSLQTFFPLRLQTPLSIKLFSW